MKIELQRDNTRESISRSHYTTRTDAPPRYRLHCPSCARVMLRTEAELPTSRVCDTCRPKPPHRALTDDEFEAATRENADRFSRRPT